MKPGSQPYLTTITPLRGIAALLVVIYHSSFWIGPLFPVGYSEFIESSWLWVDFFFVLSGFILSYAYENYIKKGITRKGFIKYMGSRFARVYPLYFVTTIWAFICAELLFHYATSIDPILAGVLDTRALPACLLMVQSMHTGFFTAPLNTPGWSLSTEWWAYVIFPFLLPFFISLKDWRKFAGVVLLVVSFILIKYLLGPISYAHSTTLNVMTDFGFLRCLAGFFSGMLLHTFFKHRSGYAIMKRDWFFVISSAALLVSMHFGLMDIAVVCFFPIIIISAAYNQTGIKRILDTKLFQRLGDWSFSIYMVHIPIFMIYILIKILKKPDLIADVSRLMIQKPDYIQNLVMTIVLVAIVLFISAIFYRFLEVPARNYFNKLFKTKKPKILFGTDS
ncbi:MAG: acyltransferase [Ferruginibacter sp.]